MHMQLGSPTAAPAAASATGSAAQQSAPTSAPGASQSLAPASSSAFPWAEGANRPCPADPAGAHQHARSHPGPHGTLPGEAGLCT